MSRHETRGDGQLFLPHQKGNHCFPVILTICLFMLYPCTESMRYLPATKTSMWIMSKNHQVQASSFGDTFTSCFDLSTALGKKSRYITHQRPKDDIQVALGTLPTQIVGVVVHKRYFESQENTQMVLECTFLTQNGDPHSFFQNYLFKLEPISAYVCCSESNVVICELEVDLSDGLESMGYPITHSQPGNPLPQMQLNYPIAQSQPTIDFGSHLQQIGYGFPPCLNLKSLDAI
jgi:hypothetical protein